MSDLYENCYCLKKKSNSLICKNETKERDELTIIIYYNCDTGLYVPSYFWSVYKSFHLQHWSRKKNIGSSACSNYMHIYMLTKLHCNIFYKSLNKHFVAQLPRQYLSAVKTVTKFMKPWNWHKHNIHTTKHTSLGSRSWLFFLKSDVYISLNKT